MVIWLIAIVNDKRKLSPPCWFNRPRLNQNVSVQTTSLNQLRKNIQTGASRSCSTTFMSLSCELKFALHGRQYMVFVKVFQQATLLHFALLLLVQSGTIEPAKDSPRKNITLWIPLWKRAIRKSPLGTASWWFDKLTMHDTTSWVYRRVSRTRGYKGWVKALWLNLWSYPKWNLKIPECWNG